MRARQRHLNLAALGATSAYDARFGTASLTDGAAMDAWRDRVSLTDATQSGSARPTFKTAQIGGQPAVQFAGSHSLVMTTTISIAPSSECLMVAQKTGSLLIGLSTNEFARGYTCIDYSDNNLYVTASTDGAGVYAANNGSAASIWLTGPSLIRLNGVARSTTSLGAAGAYVATRIGARSSEYSTGLISLVAYFPSTLSAAVRSRIEKMAALTFKLACS